jgi:23S rRNA G2069 N7-methylase RlmK/C1962 C5-methylase RlmI
MDPITLIVTALAAGVVSGVTDTTSSALQDAYASLKALVRKRFADRKVDELVLIEHESAPEIWREPLVARLGEVQADRDADLVAAAQEMMRLVHAAGAEAGKYTVDVRGAQGVQVGDHGSQHNIFGAGDQT